MFDQFTFNPTNIDVTRSRFKRPSRNLTTFNSGDLIPMYVDDLLPGDTVDLPTSFVCRMTTPVHPVMDNAYMDIFYFAVPYRLLWDHSKEFFGESQKAFEPDVEYEMPQIHLSANEKGSVYHHLGIPIFTGTENARLSINALRMRAYGLIWNEWFRDQNVMDPLYIDTGDAAVAADASAGNLDTWFDQGLESLSTDWLNGIPLPVSKFHDLFTSALPLPQKGPAVTLPLTNDPYGLPVKTSDQEHATFGTHGLHLVDPRTGFSPALGPLYANIEMTGPTTYASDEPNGSYTPMSVDNLWVLNSDLAAISVNTLRQAFALQKLYEKDARGGTRYREVIKAHFGVTSPDARMQIPEYLFGKRIPVSIAQVLQTSASNDTSPQGNTAAFSLTSDKSNGFTYSATEHCVLMGVCCIRTQQTYYTGIDRAWLRKRRYDYYWPVFANLGEQPVEERELYLESDASNGDSDAVFGYAEAWYDYRFKPNRVSGAFDPRYSTPLTTWHFAEELSSIPTLSPDFILQRRQNIDQTLTVESIKEDQFICDFFFDATYVRPMPMYSIPGLIDHH